jgi:RHS repeat-associated protein
MFKKLFSLFFLWTLTVPAAYAALQANDDNLITGASLPSSINILANDTTDTGNELTISSFDSTSTSGGTVSDNSNGVLSYTPPTGFTGNDSFSYTITDGSGSSASATVAIQVKPVTQLTGALAQDTTWTNDNVYLITGDVTVPLGVTLTINAGTVIQFQANSDDTSGGNETALSELIITNGSLVAQGTASAPILLTSGTATPAAGDWGGIRHTGNGQLTLRYVTVEYASLGVNYRVNGGFIVSPMIENSTIRHSTGRGLYLEGKGGVNLTALVTDNTVHGHSSDGIYLSATDNNTALTAFVTNNHVYSNNRYGIYLEGSSYSNSAFTTSVSNNQVHDCRYYGIYVYNRSATNDVQLVGNTVYNITHTSAWGIYVNNNNLSPRLEMVNNTVYSSQGGGLYFYNAYSSGTVTPLIERNTLRDNGGVGLHVHNYRGTHTPHVRQNTVFNNGGNGLQFDEYYYSSAFQPEISLNDVHNNGGHGLYISTNQSTTVVHNNIYDNTNNGIYLTTSEVSHINFNNLYGNTGNYALYNNSSALVDARYNWWDTAPTQEMVAGNNPKNLTRLFDIYDDGSKGTIDYGQWLTSEQTLAPSATSWVKSPANGESVKATTYHIEGGAVAPTSIDRVEVSTDGGTTWNVAIGTLHWYYDWTVPGDGAYLLKSRVITTDGTIQTAAGNTVTIDSSLATTSGVLAADETWTGTVNLTGDITVPEGVTLTIAAGTTINFRALHDELASGNDSARSELLINGSLVAEGTASEPIVFTSSGAATQAAGDWGGIRQTGSGQLTLRYATVEYASFGVDYRVDGDFTVSPTIENSTIRHTNGRGLYIEGKGGVNITASIQNNVIHNHADDGVYLYATNTNTVVSATVTGNQVYSNTDTGVYIKHDGGTDTALTATVTDNEIHTNNQYGLYISSPSGSNSAFTTLVNNNQVHDNPSYGIYVYNRSASNDVQLVGNTVYNITSSYSYGIYVNNSNNSPRLEIVNNTVHSGQGDGLYFYNNYYNGTITPLIQGNTLRDNNGTGLHVHNYRGTHTPHVRQNTVYNNGGNGLQFDYRYSSAFQPQISLNEVHDNGGHGLSISTSQSATVVHNNIYDNTNNGISLSTGELSHINFNNIYGNSGSYALYNNGSALVDARYNWWNAAPTLEMDAGNNPKNLTRLFDIYDDSSKGTVDYTHWLSAVQTLSTEATSWVKAPADGETLKATTYRIEGSAVAPTNIDKVEISTDGGTTWNAATGKLDWHYDWTVPGDGTYVVQSRVVTTDGTIKTAAAGNTVTIDNSLATTSGVLAADETWTGTVNITGDITVPEGLTLTIAAGTTVQFLALNDDTAGGHDPSRIELLINGSLIAEGTVLEPIVLTSNAITPAAGDWSGIRQTGSGQLTLRHTTVEYASFGVDYRVDGEFTVSPTIENSTIRHTNGRGLYIEGKGAANLTASIQNNAIHNHGKDGVYLSATGTNTIVSTTVTNNQVHSNNNYGIYLEGSSYSNSAFTALVNNNQVHDCRTYGIYVYNRSTTNDVQLVGNTVYNITNSSAWGIYVNNSNNSPRLEIVNNTVYSNQGGGLYFYNNYHSGAITPLIQGNTLRDNNGIGLRVHNYRGTHTPLVKQNTVYNNSGNGIQFDDYYYSSAFQPEISLNEVHDNGGYGLYISTNQSATVVHNNIYDNTNNGIYLANASELSRINFNNIYGNTGNYALYNNSSALVDARYNWWDAAPKLEMDAGNNPKNITRIFDIYDDSNKGTVDYGQWLSTQQTLSTATATSWVKAPADGETLKATTYRIEGSAVAPTGIDRVEISTDGGTTWNLATGTLQWHYDWTVPGDGAYLIKSRVITTDSTIQTAAAGNTVTIDNSLATTSGVLAADETWTGTVNITGDITVPEGVTLTIAAGATIQFLALNDDTAGGHDPARAELLINGSLIAEGTAEAPIILTRSGAGTAAAGDWGGLYQTPTAGGQLTLRHVTIEYASLGVDYRVDGDFTVSPMIENSTIRHSTGRGLYLEGKGGVNLTALVTDNTVHGHSSDGIYLSATDNNTALTATVTNNHVYSNNRYGIYMVGSSYSNSAFTTSVSNNQVHDCRTYGIYVYNRSATNDAQIVGNTVYNITNSSAWGIYVNNNNLSPRLEMVNNTVYSSQGGGLYFYNNYHSGAITPLIQGNTLRDNNGIGLRVHNYRGTHTPLVRQNTIYNNGGNGLQFDYRYSSAFQPQISLNDIHDNGGHGLSITTRQSATVVHNNIYDNTNNGISLSTGELSHINFNNIYGNTGNYALSNNSSALVDARYNWWDTAPTQEMDAGNNPKNITRLFDIYDDTSKGTVDYGHWLSATQTLATDATSWITAPADGETLKAATYRIEGAATAPTDIERVEVSTDGGTSWNVASGTLHWHYDWTVPGDGPYQLQSRVITTDGTTQTTASVNSITIDNSRPNNAGLLLADETWSGTVHLNGDIIIPEGVSLTLLPGTTVTFDRLLDSMRGGDDPNRIEIIVQGTLLSQGTAAEPVAMTSLTPKNQSDWGGIKVTGTLEMAYTTLEYGAYGLYCESKTTSANCDVQHSTLQLMNRDGITVYADNNQTAQISISDSLIQQNGRYGIYAKASQQTTQIDLGLTGNEVVQNGEYGIYLEAYGGSIQANLLNNQVHENSGYGVYIYTRSSAQSVLEVRDNQIYSIVNGDGLYINNDSAANTSSYTISGNEIYSNRNAGLRYYNRYSDVSPVITNNTVHDNTDFGIHLDHYGSSAVLVPTLSGNSIHHNGTGLSINATADTLIENSELYSNSFDIRNQSSYAVNAQGNWWGVNTTNILNTGSHPRNLSRLYDNFDDGNLGSVDYSAWLQNYATPPVPSLVAVASPIAAATQTLTGTKAADTGIMLNGVEVVAIDAQTSWTAEFTLQEGPNPISLTAFNADGLLSETVTAQIVRDTEAPSLISSTPFNGALLNTPINTIDLVLHDESTAIDLAQSMASASVTNSNNATISGAWTSQFNRLSFTADTAFADETYTVSLTAIDTPLANSASVSMSFTIDTGAPQPVTLAAVTSPTRTTPQLLSGTKEAGTAIVINGVQVVAPDNNTSWQYSLDLQEGANNLAIVAQDGAGNNSTPITASITLDTNGPKLLAITPANNTFTNQAPSTIDIALDEASSGIDETTTLNSATVQHSVNGAIAGRWTLNAEQHLIFTPDSAFVDGAYTINVDVTDLAGNVTAVNSLFTYDAMAPSLFTLNPVTTPTNNKTQTLSGDKEAGNAIWINNKEAVPADNETTWSSIVTLSNGTNTFELLARDPAGNRSDVITATIVFDEVSPLPVAELTVNGAGNGTSAALDWSNYDETAHGDIAGYWVFSADSLFTQTATMVPVVKLAAGEQSYTVTGLTKGQTYYFAVVAIDVNGNLNTSVTPVTATLSDVVPPEDITKLQAQSFVDKLLLSWTHSANSAGDLSGYKVYQDTTLVDTLAATTNTFELTGLSAATAYPIKVTAFDTDGYESSGASLTAVTLLPNPANLVATASYQSILLTWEAVSPAALVGHYAIYAAVNDFNSVAGMTPLQQVEADVLQTTLSGLINGTNYYIAVTTQNQSGGEQATVTTVSATPEADTKGPLVSEIQFEGNPLADGGTISQSGTLRLTANDGFGIGRVEFYVDGTLFHTDSNGSTQYSVLLPLTAVTDGTHTLEIKAYDTLGNVSSTSLTVSVALAAPTSTPVITQPVNGLVTNQTQITVTGSAEPGTDVVFYHNGTEVGSPLSLDDNNTFSTTVTLQAGPNELQVAARNRGGMGPVSSTTLITLDSSVPDAPGALLAEAQADGQVRLTWQATANDIAGYDVYRASQSFTALSEAQKVNSETVTATRFNDLVVTDGRYYYRVVAVNTVGTTSALSNEVSVSADATPPRATLIEYTPALTTYTQGRIDVTLTVSEPLLTTPFLTMVPDGGIPIAVELTPVTDSQYQGHFEISGTTPSGTAYAVFSARDLAGNRGTEIEAGTAINIDSDGPFITKLTLSPAEPIRNDQTNPVTVQVEIELNEALPTGNVPELSYRLSGAGRSAEAITPLTQNSPLVWSASFSLPADAGLNENETLYFIFSAADELGNVGHLIQPANQFQVYQGDLPPLTVPVGLVGTALPGGRVQLSWEAVTAATDYQLFRQAPGETELSPYQRSGGQLTFIDETKPQDGLYHYAVASVRSANAQESFSAYSNIVKVTADSTAPAAPTNLQLELVGAGIRASWTAPTGNEALSYQLYRSAEEMVSVTGLTPHQSEIAELSVIDTSPSKSEAYYAVMAIDAAGNQSPLSDSAYLNVELLPIATLTVVQEGEEYPVLSWSHAATDLIGFDLYLGSEAERIQVNATPLTETTYTDSGYNQQERIYTVVALDSNAVESPARTVVLPKLSVELQQTTPIRRAQFNTLAYQVTNHTAHVVTDIAVQVQLGNHTAHSEPFALTAGETKNVPVVVGGYADLADLSTLVTTLEIRPDSGEVAQIIRRQTVEIAEGSSLAISLQSQQLTRGSNNGQVKFRAENTSAVEIDIVVATAGGTAASDEVQFMLLDADDNVLTVQAFQQSLGSQIVTLSNGKTVARIPAGGSFESDWTTLPVPSSAPSQVYLKLAIANIHYRLGKTEALSIAGMETRQAVALIDTSYYGEITNITPATSYGDEPIVITGNAKERTSSNAIPLVPLQVVINLQGFERSYPVYTDQNGAFSYTFTPLATESGTYKVSVVHPDLTERPEQGQFVIQRIELGTTDNSATNNGSSSVDGSDYTVNLRMPFNDEQRIDVPVTAGANAEEHNVRLVYEAVDQPLGELPSGVQVNLGNALSVLNAGEQALLGFTVSADNTAESTGTLVLKLISDERSDTPIGRVIVNYQFSIAQPALFPSPSIIETGVNLDSSVTETLTLENQGVAALTGLTVELLNEDGTMAPGWIYLTTQNALGTLAIGDKRDIQLMASPSASVSEGDYLFIVRASGDNHAALDTYVSVTVTQSGIGHVLFKAADIYTATLDDQGNVIEGLAGAEIHIQNEKVLTVDKTLTTDKAGEALFSDLPAGRYKFKATAENHQEVIGRFRIKPGVTVSETVFLDYNLVTVEWSVTETTIEDRYEITLEATYETEVPAAVVVAEPMSVNLPDMQPGDVYYGEFTLTNYGLIRADDLTLELPEDDQYFKYELLGHVPSSLNAKERITIPYRVTALKALDKSAEGSGGGCDWWYERQVLVFYFYNCAYDLTLSASVEISFYNVRGQCGGIGGGGSGGSGGSGSGGIGGGGGGSTGNDSICTGCNGRGVSPPPKPTPKPDPIDGAECWPKAENWEPCEQDDYINETLGDAVNPVGSSVNSVLREFNDYASDLRVKVPGGMINITRWFTGNTWHWSYPHQLTENWWHYRYSYNSLGGGIHGIVKILVSLDKTGVTYVIDLPESGKVPENTVYSNRNAKIIQTEEGYKWQHKSGKWKEYDSDRKLLSFGNRTGLLGTLLYDGGQAQGIVDRDGRQVIWFEYRNQQLSAVRDLENRRVEYRYSVGKLTDVKDVLGQHTRYQYYDELLTKKVDSGGKVTLIEYKIPCIGAGCKLSNNVSTRNKTRSSVSIEVPKPDLQPYPIAVTDEKGVGLFFEYDYDSRKKEYYSRITSSSGMIKEVWYYQNGETKRVDINGRTVKMLDKESPSRRAKVSGSKSETWKSGNGQGNGRELWITDEKGNVTHKTYDEWYNLIRVVYPDKTTESFAYEHRFNRLTRAVDRRGNVTLYRYDDYGNLVQKTEAAGTAAERVTTLTYDEQHQLITITVNGNTEADAATTHLSYDSNGNIASMTDPLGNTVAFRQYDTMGNPSAITDARGFIWRMNYDALGRLLSITDPLNQTRTYEYDGANNNTAVVDEAQNRFESVYNKHKRIIKAIDPFLNESRIIYNSDQLPVEVIDELGNRSLAEYDNEGRLTRSVDGAGNPIVLHYDETRASLASSYLPVKIDYPTYSQQLYYDKLQRLVRTTEVLETNTRYSVNYTYDAADNVVKEIDQQGHTTHYEYDALNRLTKITDALKGVTELSYDTRDNLTAVKDANGGITRFEYDKNNNLVKLIRPMGEVTQYAYDAANNQTARLDAKGQKIAYQYDALDRLTQVDYYAATDHNTPVKTVRFSYDAVGNLLSYDDGTTSASYRYDALQRKLSETVNYGPFALSHHYDYYANGLKKAFTGPNGVKIGYEYDSNNRLSAIDIPNAGRVTYNTYQWNSPAKITLPGGSQIELAYDPLMRLQSQVRQDAANNVITRADYEHSPTDQVTKKTTEAGEYTYQYDEVSRLTKATHPVLDNESYSYDLVGNRLTAAGVPDGASYNANNALIRYGEAAFEHDANGNLVKQTLGTEVRHYVYDVDDRLVRVEDGSGNILAEYTYDPFGRRLWKEVNGVKTYFGYADEGVIGEYDENGVETKAYGYAPNSLWTTNPIFQKNGGAYYWYQTDHLGTPQKLLDNAGNVVWAAHYESFGHAQVEVALIENNLRFPGQYYDVETGLHYNWHRYYDPIGGRYSSVDPLLFGGGDINLYEYVLNDPVNLIDPTGEIWHVVVPIAAGVLAALWVADAIMTANILLDPCVPLGEKLTAGALFVIPIPFLGPLGKALARICNSFPADTLVHTDNGLKPIAEIEIGDKVLSFDEKSGTTSYQPVVAVIQNEQQYQFVNITLDTGKSIEATAEHPFYIKGKGWNPASSLKVGQVLVLHNGTTVVVEEIDTSVRTEKVYNLTVANTHNYYVGWDGVLVHNINCKTLYRVIRPDENPAVGLVAKNPSATYKPEGHIINGSKPNFNSQYISTTTDLSVAEKWAAKTGNRIVEIDPSKVKANLIDLSTESGRNAHLKGVTAKNFAAASSEVLIEGEVPSGALKIIK